MLADAECRVGEGEKKIWKQQTAVIEQNYSFVHPSISFYNL